MRFPFALHQVSRGPFLRLGVKLLVIPALILSERDHALIPQQFLSPLGVSSRLEVAQRKAVAPKLRADGDLLHSCSCAQLIKRPREALFAQRMPVHRTKVSLVPLLEALARASSG
jgi:hypothetical protein